MALVNPIIFQIVGFQDSGKTTFIKVLLEELLASHLTAVTIKHHGHGGRPSVNENKDSHQHVQAGAIASIVEGAGHLLMQSGKRDWSLDEQIQLATLLQPDFILIEGHKGETYPKAVLIREKEDIPLLETLKGIQVIYYWEENSVQKKNRRYPSFHIQDKKGITWLVDTLKQYKAEKKNCEKNSNNVNSST